jgi:hypothetical protein
MFYLHIGLQKTATTTLQDDVFPVLPDIKYLGRKKREHGGDDEFYILLCRYCFSAIEDTILYDVLINEVSRLDRMKLDYLISEEWFLTDYDGFYFGSGASWQTKINRLAKVFTKAKVVVILSVREPCAVLYSLYCQNQQRQHPLSYGSFQEFYKFSNDAKVYNPRILLPLLKSNGFNFVELVKYDIFKDKYLLINRLCDIFMINNFQLEYGNKNNYKKRNDGRVLVEKENSLSLFVKRLPGYFPYWLVKAVKKVVGDDINVIARFFRKTVDVPVLSEMDRRWIEESYEQYK